MALTHGTGQVVRSTRRRLSARGPAATGVGAPPVASQRAYLASGLPQLYREGDFGMRFIGGLETLLDPVVALLDALPAHLDPQLAPTDLLALYAAWLGIDLDESWPAERRRALVDHAGELTKKRGTKAGLELALSISFPHLPLRVEDGGGVTWARDPASLPPSNPKGFVVKCDTPLDKAEQDAVARAIERVKPAHMSYRLRVRAARSGGGSA